MDLWAPLRINVQLTMACNQRCSYCYNPDHDPHRTMTVADFELVTQRILDAGIFKVALAGGEPLVHPHFFELYLHLAKRSPTLPIILTNGSVWTRSTLSRLDELQRHHTPKIQVSLDSLSPVAGLQDRRVDRTVEFIDSLIALGIRPSLGTLVTKSNVEQIPQIVERFGDQIEFYHFMAPMSSLHNAEQTKRLRATDAQIDWLAAALARLGLPYDFDKEFSDLESRTARSCGSNCGRGCAAGYTHCVITPELDVMACEITPELTLGNLREHSFRELWTSRRAREVQAADFPLCHDATRYTQLVRGRHVLPVSA